MNSEVPDQELMERVKAGDAEAFGALYDRLASAALRIAHGVLRDANQAQDAVHEAFLTIWRGRDRYEPRQEDVRGWVSTLAYNRALDRLQSGQADANGAGGLETMLAELGEPHREVIALAHYGGLSHSEIAAQLDVPARTVRRRMRLGLSELHARLP